MEYVFAIALLGGIGYFVYKNKDSFLNKATPVANPAPADKPAKDDVPNDLR